MKRRRVALKGDPAKVQRARALMRIEERHDESPWKVTRLHRDEGISGYAWHRWQRQRQ